MPSTPPGTWVPRPRLPARPAAKTAAMPAAAKAAKGGLVKWVASHKLLATLIVAGAAVPAAVIGSLVLIQPVTTNPAAQASDVVFVAGADYTAINAAGFATLTLANGASTATLDVKGVPGAISVTMGDVLKVQNTDAAKSYDVALSVSGTPNAAITSYVIQVENAANAEQAQWDAIDGTPADNLFTLAPSTTYDVTVTIVVASGTAIGSLGSFDIHLTSTMV